MRKIILIGIVLSTLLAGGFLFFLDYALEVLAQWNFNTIIAYFSVYL